MGSAAEDAKKELENAFGGLTGFLGGGNDDPLEALGNAIVTVGTGGLVSMDRGRARVGPMGEVAWNLIDEPLGEITGRNIMREQTYLSLLGLEREERRRAAEAQENLKQAEKVDRAKSFATRRGNSAGDVTRSAMPAAQSAGRVLGADEQTLLGG